MAELKCAVDSCTYNSDRLCCKGDILVGGKNARKEQDTCCESFQKRKEGQASNSMNPTGMISIDCQAVKCVYNTDHRCSAERVDIRGCGADNCRETICATFRER
ncbi:MAG TPA: DUF1540 domain-containing protein [Candidatus Eisenbergiella pullistercoris]|uniref:DUF1540 domain-containing protein n=1 Tax=Candidatus Eisenbergiella pullistercoris TaxID=2838555 RepID=A0A9D1YNF8_9FIRM|nr:DUF1540 domain-containing protein [Candidatus Eisenbergiella pullistercoris]